MKKLLWALVVSACVLAGFSFVSASQFDDQVFPWMIDNGLTQFSRKSDFRPNDSITRGEASKFIVSYGDLIELENQSSACDFRDIIGYDDSLVPFIEQACAYGLFRGSNGNFLPRNTITEAEALAVVIRSLEGFLDEGGDLWYEEYFLRASDLGIIDSSESLSAMGNKKITREKLGTWLYRAYHSDALESIIVYETEVEDASECSSYETYDAQRGVCEYECLSEAECADIQEQIDAELRGWAEAIDGEERDEPQSEGKPSQGSKVVYSVWKGESIARVSGTDSAQNRAYWQEVAELSPDWLSDAYIERFELYEDASSDVIAYVVDDDGNGKWNVAINLPVHTSSDARDQKATIIHELSHIITLNADQFASGTAPCTTYETDEGCTLSTAYMYTFAKKFWPTSKTATYSQEKFVSEYASSSPEEDIAESFAFYVLQSNHSNDGIRAQKMNFFNSYPEMVAVREAMRKTLATDIIRAKKGK